jgi:tetratricopeptide (TPR) repeat protein
MLKGRHDEAYPILEESLQLAKDNLGDRHPTTIHSLGLYAWVCGVVRPVDETIPLHVEVMARFRDVLGENHPKTLDAMMNAAVAYMENDDESETIRLLEFALPKFREKVGDSHESTIISVTYLAEAYLAADRPHEALALLTASEDATSVQRFHGRRFLAESLLKTGQRETGAKMLKELLVIQRTEFAEDPAGMADALAQIAVRYLNANMHSEAEPLLREAQDLVNASSEPNDGLQSYVQSALGIALTESGKYDEAESLLLAGARGLLAERTEPPFPYPQNICESLRRLIRFYEITEQPLEAAKWRKIAVGRIPDDE